MYVDKLDNIVNKCNNTFHNTIKMKPVDIKSITNIDFGTKIMIKTLNFKLMSMLEYRNIQNVFAKGYTPN